MTIHGSPSGSKSKPSNREEPGFLLGLIFDPEDRSDIMFRNVNELSPKYAALCTRYRIAYIDT
jgi:hypothetical protein